jgi:hypothetical protein
VPESANPAANAIVASFMILFMLSTQTTNGRCYSIVLLKSS